MAANCSRSFFRCCSIHETPGAEADESGREEADESGREEADESGREDADESGREDADESGREDAEESGREKGRVEAAGGMLNSGFSSAAEGFDVCT